MQKSLIFKSNKESSSVSAKNVSRSEMSKLEFRGAPIDLQLSATAISQKSQHCDEHDNLSA